MLGQKGRLLHHPRAQALRLRKAAARRRNHHQAAREPLGQHPLRPVQHQDGRHGEIELSQPPGVSHRRRHPIPAQVLRAMIAKTGFAIASEETRYTLNGALMVLKPESITMVATDGHRLAHIERSGEKFEGVSGEMKTLIPKKCMDELKSLVDSTEVESIDFAKDESTLFFRIGPRLLTSRQLTGQFPNFEAVLPKDNNKLATLNGDDFNAAIQRVAQFSDERSRA